MSQLTALQIFVWLKFQQDLTCKYINYDFNCLSWCGVRKYPVILLLNCTIFLVCYCIRRACCKSWKLFLKNSINEAVSILSKTVISSISVYIFHHQKFHHDNNRLRNHNRHKNWLIASKILVGKGNKLLVFIFRTFLP